MSGISKSFKIPSLIKNKSKIRHSLPTFDWKDVSCMQDFCVGSFGSVHSAKFVQGTEKKTVVVKKLRGESDESKRRFVKEVKC